MNLFTLRFAVVGYITPNNVLVVSCGLLAKWLKVRVRIRARVRECTIVFSSGLISVVNTFLFIGLVVPVSMRRVTQWYHVTWLATSIPQIE